MAHSSVEQASKDGSAVVAGAVLPTSEEPVLAPGASAEDAACGFSADDRVARQEITDALSCFLHVCSQVQGYADLQALSTAAWLLKELADPSEVASTPAASCEDNTRPPPLVNAEQAQQLREAAAAATTGLRDLLVGPWGDALASLLCSQWGLASLVAQAPALGDEHAAAQILYSAADTARIASETGSDAPAAPPPTALSAEHALLAARRWMVSHAVCTLFCGERKLAAAPLLAAPPDGYVCSPSELREGSAAPAISLEGVPCRVAFERGKERNVLLSVAASGVTLPLPSDAAASCFTANVLLVETAKGRGGGNSASASGVVHAVAPAAGAEVRASARQLRIATAPDATVRRAAVRGCCTPKVAPPARAPISGHAAVVRCAATCCWRAAVGAWVGAAAAAQLCSPPAGWPLDVGVCFGRRLHAGAGVRTRADAADARGVRRRAGPAVKAASLRRACVSFDLPGTAALSVPRSASRVCSCHGFGRCAQRRHASRDAAAAGLHDAPREARHPRGCAAAAVQRPLRLLSCYHSRGAFRAVAHALRHACRPTGVWQGNAVAEDQGTLRANALAAATERARV